MSHPAKQINETSNQIVNGEYDKAIVSLTNTLKTLKLVLSGDAKILVPKEMEDENDEDQMDHSESSASSTESFEYDFFSSPTSSSFLKTVVAVNGRSSSRHHHIDTHDCSSDRCECKCRESSSSSATATSANGPQHELQLSIFRDPIVVWGDHFLAPLDMHICEELSYVAIYNLALSHHLKSLELASRPSQQHARRIYLQKALSLYEHSHQILMKQQRINVGAPVIHSMALVSNLSQIHHTLGDHAKAEMCKQYLLSTMMYVIDCGKVDSLGNSLDGFFNIIQPLISGDVPAPAA